jgi:mono/diheme cytochrome c family protein
LRTISAVTLMCFAPSIVGAAELGDASRGHEYAKNVCASCHAVEAGDKFSPELLAPTFDNVAATPGMNERALGVWLRGSDHDSMPNLMLSPENLNNVVAYIMSLRAQNQPR